MKFNEELPRILVVDDKQQNRMLITEYLESRDVIIDEAPIHYSFLIFRCPEWMDSRF